VPGAEFRVLNSIDGHLALFGADRSLLTQLDGHLKELLATG
jgi:homoserine O-acetyltransferase